MIKSIQHRIGAYILGCAIVISVILVGTSIWGSNSVLSVTSEKTEKLVYGLIAESLEGKTAQISTSVTEELLAAKNYVMSLALSFEAVKQEQAQGGIGAQEIRQLYSGILAKSAQEKPEYLGYFSVWEPNVLGGADKIFSFLPGHNSQKRFAPYWVSKGGDAEVKAIEEFDNQILSIDGAQHASFYNCTRQQLSSCLIPPHESSSFASDEIILTFAAPIIVDNKFYGAVGLNLDSQFLQELSIEMSSHLLDGNSTIEIVTSNGTVLASSSHTSQGSKLSGFKPQQKSLDLNNVSANGALQTIVPISVEGFDLNWFLVVQLPREAVLGDIADLEQEILNISKESSYIQILLSIIVTVVVVAATYVSTRKMVNPIRESVSLLSKVAQGDLTQRISCAAKDETLQLINSCNEFLGKTQPVIRQVTSSTDDLVSVSKQVTSSASSIRESAGKQQQELDLLAAATEEMFGNSKELASISQSATQASESGQIAIKQGCESMGNLSVFNQEFTGELERASESLERLKTGSQQVENVVSVIRGIAEQTNLLALNAAIESARAGEQGRGFSVVADEVRALAKRTQDSTETIGDIITSLVRDSEQTCSVMNGSLEKAKLSHEHVNNVQEALSNINATMEQINQLNLHVASASSQQSNVAQEISLGVNSLSEGSYAVVNETVKSQQQSESLIEISSKLSSTIGNFKA